MSDLYDAAVNGDLEKVQSLLSTGADVNCKDDMGFTPLMGASTMGHLAVVRTLLAKGAEVNAADTIMGSTALMRASSHGYCDVARALLEHGANLHAETYNGATALIMATARGHIDVRALLLRTDTGSANLVEQEKPSRKPMKYNIRVFSYMSEESLRAAHAYLKARWKKSVELRKATLSGLCDYFLVCTMTEEADNEKLWLILQEQGEHGERYVDNMCVDRATVLSQSEPLDRSTGKLTLAVLMVVLIAIGVTMLMHWRL